MLFFLKKTNNKTCLERHSSPAQQIRNIQRLCSHPWGNYPSSWTVQKIYTRDIAGDWNMPLKKYHPLLSTTWEITPTQEQYTSQQLPKVSSTLPHQSNTHLIKSLNQKKGPACWLNIKFFSWNHAKSHSRKGQVCELYRGGCQLRNGWVLQ